MEVPLSSAQRLALASLERGRLCRTDHGWIVASEQEEQVLGGDVVRWLFGERLVELDPQAEGVEAYRLTDWGSQAAREAAERLRAARSATSLHADLRGAPLLLIAPASHSEEMDWLLVVPLTGADCERHRSRLAATERIQRESSEGFEFVQYADEIYAIPVSPRSAELGLIPDPDDPVVYRPNGLDDPADVGMLRCADRGVNYGAKWIQWFGTFDAESPLIVSQRVGLERFRAILTVKKARGG